MGGDLEQLNTEITTQSEGGAEVEPEVDHFPVISSRWKIGGVFLLKLLITCGFLTWAFSQIESDGALKAHFFQALSSPGWVAIGLAFAGASLLAGALRYYILLRALSIEVSLAYVCKLSLMAALLNIASLGVTAGDAVKVIGVMRRHRQKK